ncbi:tRNA pseudouridine(55) synthase TruB [Granulicatella sp.]
MDGILPLWKEKGMTSFDCVFKVRRLLQTKKVGHSGTLDPEVDGVLPICVGKATKVVEYLLESNKVYQGEICLGIATETEDAHGEIVKQEEIISPFTIEEIDAMMETFKGEIIQIPPMYSAVKVNGKRLYEYARKGETVERPERRVKIYEFKRTSTPVYDEASKTQKWTFEVSCSKGTYVRTLAVDLGEKLGVPAHMSQLTRIKSGPFVSEQCVTLSQLEALVEQNQAQSVLRPLEEVFETYPRVDVPEEFITKVKNGAILTTAELPQVIEPSTFYIEDELIALYGPHPEKKGLLKPIKMF